MKLTTQESIQEREKEFIDTINAELDWDAIEQMLLDKHGFSVEEEVNYKDGNLVVYKDQIAYKFEFEIKVPLSVIFNRDGECLDISTRSAVDDEDDASSFSEPLKGTKDPGDISGAASEIANMISEINQQGD